MQVLFPLLERMPNTSQRDSQLEDVEKSQLRAWLLVSKTFVSHAVVILESPDCIDIWHHLMSLHEKLFCAAKTIDTKTHCLVAERIPLLARVNSRCTPWDFLQAW